MFYIKNGILRESKKPLETADGRTVYNAPLEMWEAEGWEIYDPEKVARQQQEQAAIENLEEEQARTLEEVREDVLHECEDFYKSIVLKISYQNNYLWISAGDRVKYLQILKDAQEEELVQVKFQNFDLTIGAAIEYLKAMNVYELKCRCAYEEHRQNILKISTVEELEYYDYTNGYPEPLVLG